MALFESGLIYPKQINGSSVKIKRGMTILAQDRQEVGRVAAIVFEDDSQRVTHILLAPLRLTLDYRLVSINLIQQVSEEVILLHIDSEAIASLPHRQK